MVRQCKNNYELVELLNLNNKFGTSPIILSSEDNYYIKQLIPTKDDIINFYFSDIQHANFSRVIDCRSTTYKSNCINKFKYLIESAVKSILEPLGFNDAFIELIVKTSASRNNADAEWHTDGNNVARQCISGKIPENLCNKVSDQRFVIPFVGNGTVIYGETISDVRQDRHISHQDMADRFNEENTLIPHYEQIGYFFLDNNLNEGIFHKAPFLQGDIDRILLSITPIDSDLKDMVDI
jgi:hypothetical protein